MTQTTGAISGVANYVAVSTDGSSWTDISGMANKVEADSQKRTSGETYTFDGDTAILGWGKLEPLEITVTIVYTEGASDAFKKALTSLQTAGGARLQVRWAPKGNTAPNFQFTSGSDSKVSEMPPGPAPDATSGDPVVLEFKIRTASITQAAIAT